MDPTRGFGANLFWISFLSCIFFRHFFPNLIELTYWIYRWTKTNSHELLIRVLPTSILFRGCQDMCSTRFCLRCNMQYLVCGWVCIEFFKLFCILLSIRNPFGIESECDALIAIKFTIYWEGAGTEWLSEEWLSEAGAEYFEWLLQKGQVAVSTLFYFLLHNSKSRWKKAHEKMH